MAGTYPYLASRYLQFFELRFNAFLTFSLVSSHFPMVLCGVSLVS